jgi:hypothetical protein
MDLNAYLVHSSPGRMRIRIPSMRNNLEFFQHAADTLQTMNGVTSTRINPRSASILVLHDDITPDTFKNLTSETGLFELQLDYVEGSMIDLNTIKDISNQALGVGGTFSRSMFFYLLMGLAIRQVMKGQFMAPAISLFWYAFEILDTTRNNKS